MKKFDVHKWNQKRRLLEQDDDPNWQKRQDDMTPGKNPDAFYGDGSLDKLRDLANDDEEDYDFDPEDDYVDEIELKDLDFKTLKSFFPKFYQKEKFTRPQTGEPVYSDAISFPNLDDSMMEIGDSSALEDWKAKVLRRFGPEYKDVVIEFNDEARNHFDRVFIHSDDFNDARDEFIRGKMSAMQGDMDKGRSID